MTAMTNYLYGAHEVRRVDEGGEPWFVLADVCKILGLGNPSMTADKLDEDEKGINLIDTLKGKQEMLTVNEFGLYEVIIRSDKPEAKAFRRWITHEVIPQIARRANTR